MDFFEAQDKARKKTWQLGLLFTAAVIVLILVTNVLLAGTYLAVTGGLQRNAGAGGDVATLLATIPPEVWLWSSLGVITVVALASFYKFQMIRGGGKAIAESLGGTRVQSNTQDLKSRRLLNVVEEMAIAAGVSVPPVYLLNEPGINAFAAGYTPDDAVIGITEGALNFLNREELQGVIAHEFSHILNGDSRINIRLIAILFGILFIGLVGNLVLRGSGRGVGRSDREGGGGVAAALILGAGLAVVGYAGTFFGNLIKAAVSRQREYLADAAAVQYTRNPKGISGALQKIGSAGSRLDNSGANEISHMFFGQAISHFMGSIMATHPPLPKRISAIDPSWNGAFPNEIAPQTVTTLDAGASGFAGGVSPQIQERANADATEIEGVTVEIDTLPDLVGRPNDHSYRTADAIIDTTDSLCLNAARDPGEAHLLVYSLLLNESLLSKDEVAAQFKPAEQQIIAKLIRELLDQDDLHRLALLELSVPALKQMSHPQYKDFVARVVLLIRADRRIDLFEWVMHRLLLKELAPHFDKPRPPKIRFKKVERVSQQAAVLVATLANYGHDSATEASAAFASAMKELQLAAVPDEPNIEKDDNFSALNKALTDLRDLAPLQKPKLLKACASSVLFDKRISPEEGAMLQGISAALDCPLPPSVVAKSESSTA